MSRVKMKWNKPIKTKLKNHLDALEVELVNYPSWEELKSYIPQFVDVTWMDSYNPNYTEKEKEELLELTFKGKMLPTALETIRLTFVVKGLTLIDVTHLLRHRVFSFSAQCTADRDMRDDDCLVPPSIIHNEEFYKRCQELVELSKQLYADMVDSKEVSIFDARYILPRAMETFYFVSGNIKDIMQFIKTRKDEAIQPESDNIIALLMYKELVKVYPIVKDLINFNEKDFFFCKTAIEGHNSLAYLPKKENEEILEYVNKDNFIYSKKREEFHTGRYYLTKKEEILKEIK